jgi:hypothetical protein
MKKTILEIYALSACFVAVVCLVIASGVALYCFVQLAIPQFTMSGATYSQFQTNDAYWASCAPGLRHCASGEKSKERPSESELTSGRAAGFATAIDVERRDGAQGLVKSAIFILVSLVVFFFHWQLAKRARSSAA